MAARGWVLLGVCSALWGLPYLLIKVAVEDGVPASGVVVARALVGLACLLPFVGIAGLRALRGRWRQVAVLATLDMAFPFLLLAVAEREVASSLAGILIAAVPLLIALLALRFDASERVAGLRLAGLLVGMVGIVLLLGLEVSGSPAALAAAAMILVAALSYAGATLYLKRHLLDVPPLALVAGTLLVTSAALGAPAAAQAGSWPALDLELVAALVTLGAGCTAAAYAAFYALVRIAGATRASLNTYLSPAIAAVLGFAVLGESIGAGAVAGLLLILCGSWLGGRGAPPLEEPAGAGSAQPAPAAGREAPLRPAEAPAS
jgi:drug/metabolite transporter (DMT)-like permease